MVEQPWGTHHRDMFHYFIVVISVYRVLKQKGNRELSLKKIETRILTEAINKSWIKHVLLLCCVQPSSHDFREEPQLTQGLCR